MVKRLNLADYQYNSRWIGSGSQGHVYEYKCPQTNQVFAAKVLYKVTKSHTTSLAQLKKINEWQSREVLSIKETQNDHLIRAHDVYSYPEGYIILMPYFPLGNLSEARATTPFDMKDNKESMAQILDALQSLHFYGAVHRDVKPANVLVKSLHPLHLVLSDLGQVSFAIPTTAVGTSCYKAPEIPGPSKDSKLEVLVPYDKKVDIYSAGKLIIWLLGREAMGFPSYDPDYWTLDRWEEFVGAPLKSALDRFQHGNKHAALSAAQAMLSWDPQQRPSAEACLKLPWFTEKSIRQGCRNRKQVRYDYGTSSNRTTTTTKKGQVGRQSPSKNHPVPGNVQASSKRAKKRGCGTSPKQSEREMSVDTDKSSQESGDPMDVDS